MQMRFSWLLGEVNFKVGYLGHDSSNGLLEAFLGPGRPVNGAKRQAPERAEGAKQRARPFAPDEKPT